MLNRLKPFFVVVLMILATCLQAIPDPHSPAIEKADETKGVINRTVKDLEEGKLNDKSHTHQVIYN